MPVGTAASVKGVQLRELTDDVKAQIKSLGSLVLYEVNQGQVPLGECVDEQLAAMGIKPSDIDAVLLTHLDCDHANGKKQLRAKSSIWKKELRAKSSIWKKELRAVSSTGAYMKILPASQAPPTSSPTTR